MRFDPRGVDPFFRQKPRPNPKNAQSYMVTCQMGDLLKTNRWGETSTDIWQI